MVESDQQQEDAWVQVIGRIAVHEPERGTRVLAGASRVLLAILVAAGRSGISIENIADAYWNGRRPRSWQATLRIAASHLSGQLPPGWTVSAEDERFCLQPDVGFVDAWRALEELPTSEPLEETPWWLAEGAPFAPIYGLELVDEAREKLVARIAGCKPPASPVTAQDDLLHDSGVAALAAAVLETPRALVMGPAHQRRLITNVILAQEVTQRSVVIGDAGLLLPLGPFAIAFPELRSEIGLERGVLPPGTPMQAFRIVTEALANQRVARPQQILIINAHELDPMSLELASLLIERAPQSAFSLVLLADDHHPDVRWLDFVRRSITAGCKLITCPPD